MNLISKITSFFKSINLFKFLYKFKKKVVFIPITKNQMIVNPIIIAKNYFNNLENYRDKLQDLRVTNQKELAEQPLVSSSDVNSSIEKNSDDNVDIADIIDIIDTKVAQDTELSLVSNVSYIRIEPDFTPFNFRYHHKRRKAFFWFKKTLKIFCILLMLLILVVTTKVIIDYNQIGSIKNKLTKFYDPEASYILDRDGKIIFDYREKTKKEEIPFNQIPDLMKASLLVREDDDFYNSFGISYKNTISPPIKCFTTMFKTCIGGSGIYQQLIKNFEPNADRSLGIKYTENLKAIKLARELPQDKALELYLNNMPFGRQSVGVEMSFKSFFGHSIRQIDDSSPKKSCLVAVMTNSPSIHTKTLRQINLPEYNTSPKVQQNYTDLENLVDNCVDKLVSFKLKNSNTPVINVSQGDSAKKFLLKDLVTKEQLSINQVDKYYIKDLVEEELMNYYPEIFIDYDKLYEILYTNKLVIKTTINNQVQSTIDQSFNKFVKDQKNQGKQVNNASAMILKPNTSEILGVLGDLDYRTSSINKLTSKYNTIVPGYTTRAILEASTFDNSNSFNPYTILPDAEFQDPILGTKVGSSYGNVNYKGNISIKDGLQDNKHTILTQMLYLNQNISKDQSSKDFLLKDGIANYLLYSKNLGLEYQNEDSSCTKTAQLALGLCPVNGFSLIKTLNTLANNGNYNRPHMITEVQSEIDGSLTKIIDLNGSTLKTQTSINKANSDLSNQVLALEDSISSNNNQNGMVVNSFNPDQTETQSEYTSVLLEPNLSSIYWLANLNSENQKQLLTVDPKVFVAFIKGLNQDLKNNLGLTSQEFKADSLLETKINPQTGTYDKENGITVRLTKSQKERLEQVALVSQDTLKVDKNMIFNSRTVAYEPIGKSCTYFAPLFNASEFLALSKDINENPNYHQFGNCIKLPTSFDVKINYSSGTNKLNYNEFLLIDTKFDNPNQKLNKLEIILEQVDTKAKKIFITSSAEYIIPIKELAKGQYSLSFILTDTAGQSIRFDRGGFIISQ
jgi:membrane peptidoglycan carboxypeptidase